MKDRKDVVSFIIIQMNDFNTNKPAWHYGLVELRELLDFMYESKPKNCYEKLCKEDLL